MQEGSPGRRGRFAASILTSAGVLVLAVDVVISAPAAMDVLRDPAGHAAQDAGMAAIFLYIPLAFVGVICLLAAWLLHPTRARGVALVTAVAVISIVIANLQIGSVLPLAVIVGIGGSVLAVWMAWRDLPETPTG
jgi:hypothetical protein